ncbi:MAG: sarcosine oxidase subunit gamma family protein, partial [Nitratireductor sp.]
DLSPDAFPVGACSRTVFGKAEIILWRTEGDAFRVECWRSFSDYVFMLLEAAARDR